MRITGGHKRVGITRSFCRFCRSIIHGANRNRSIGTSGGTRGNAG